MRVVLGLTVNRGSGLWGHEFLRRNVPGEVKVKIFLAGQSYSIGVIRLAGCGME